LKNERSASGLSSFLPVLSKKKSLAGKQRVLNTPSQHLLYSPLNHIYNLQGGVLQSPAIGLHIMAMRGQPTSENRIFSQHSEGSS